jgi:hypothetical protein
MGIFSKKRTTTNTETTNVTATKVVKLSYMQSLIVDGGTASVDDFAGLSNPETLELDPRKSRSYNDAGELNRQIGQIGGLGSILTHMAAQGLVAVTNALFGKKTTTSRSVSLSTTGWSIVKTWKQPEFNIIRYALGIKELQISNFNYAPVSELVSKPWKSPKEITKIRLLVNQYVPEDFPPGSYIEYYIKPNSEEVDWIRINPVQLPSAYSENGNVIPRILYFNSEKPIGEASEERYFITTVPVTSIRLKIILRRPENLPDTMTPVVKNYRILMTPRGGL